MARAKKVAAVKKSTATIKQFDTIIRPIITEKTMALMQEHNKVTVEVDAKANKAEVKLAFAAVFGVKVKDVRILNVLPKDKRVGRYSGQVSGYKKAIVTLAEGEALDLFKE